VSTARWYVMSVKSNPGTSRQAEESKIADTAFESRFVMSPMMPVDGDRRANASPVAGI
jgi:hypothetical protein